MNIADENAHPPDDQNFVAPPLKAETKEVVIRVGDSGNFEFDNQIELSRAAQLAIDLSLVPQKLIDAGGKKAAAAALVMCKQFGLPMKAMNEMGWIEGNLTVYGSLYWALCERHPEYGEHEMFWLDKDQNRICSDNKNLNAEVWAAVIKVKKKGATIWNEYFFTLDEAKTAELYPPMKNEWVNKQKTGKKIENTNSPWWKYIKDMLMHKVKKRMGDANYSSALNGVIYHEDALEHLTGGDDPKDVTPPKDTDELKNAFKQ